MDNLKKEIFDFLQHHHICTVATIDQPGEPNAAVVLYYIDEDFYFYFMTRKTSDKYKNLMQNPKVAFVVFDESNRKSVQARGVAEIVEISGKNNVIFNHILDMGYKGDVENFAPIMAIDVDSPIIIFKSTIKSIKWLKPGINDQMIVQELAL